MEMSKIDVFRFLEDFEEAMKPLKKKYGVFIFEREVISAEQDTFSFKVQVSNEEKEKEKQFKQNCQYFSNVDESMYQQIFQGNDGQLYTLIGLNPIAKKNPHLYPCVLKDEKGMEYTAPFSFIGLSEN